MEISCPNCDKKYQVGEDKIGNKVACKNCDKTFVIPKSAPETPNNQQPTLSHNPSGMVLESKKNNFNMGILVFYILSFALAPAILCVYFLQLWIRSLNSEEEVFGLGGIFFFL